jgi:hypothetical protein
MFSQLNISKQLKNQVTNSFKINFLKKLFKIDGFFNLSLPDHPFYYRSNESNKRETKSFNFFRLLFWFFFFVKICLDLFWSFNLYLLGVDVCCCELLQF